MALPWLAEFRCTLESGKWLFRLDNLAAYRFERLAKVPIVGFILELDEAIRRPDNEQAELRELVDMQRLYQLLYCLTATHRLRVGLKVRWQDFLAQLPLYGTPRWSRFVGRVLQLLGKAFRDEREEISDVPPPEPAPEESGS